MSSRWYFACRTKKIGSSQSSWKTSFLFRSLGDEKQFRSSRSVCAIVQFYNLPSKFELAVLIRYYIYIGTREAGVKRLDWIVSSNITKEQMDGYIGKKQEPYCFFYSFLIYSFSIFLILNCLSLLFLLFCFFTLLYSSLLTFVCLFFIVSVYVWFCTVDRARQSFRQSFRMTSMRRSRRNQQSSSGLSSPPIDDSACSSASSTQDPEGRLVSSSKLESPKEEEENPFP